MLILAGGIVCLSDNHLKRNNRDVAKQSLEELDRARSIWLSCLLSVWNSCVNPISWTLGHRMGECPCCITCLSLGTIKWTLQSGALEKALVIHCRNKQNILFFVQYYATEIAFPVTFWSSEIKYKSLVMMALPPDFWPLAHSLSGHKFLRKCVCLQGHWKQFVFCLLWQTFDFSK